MKNQPKYKLDRVEKNSIKVCNEEVELSLRVDPSGEMPEGIISIMNQRLGEGEHAQTLLDVGCGYGRMIWQLSRIGISNYVGVDPAEKMLTVARERNPGKTFIQTDLYSLADHFPDEYFGAFWALNVFQYVPPEKVVKALRSIRRVIRTGGVGLISFSFPAGSYRIINNGEAPKGYVGPVVTVYGIDLDMVVPKLSAAGFRVCGEGVLTGFCCIVAVEAV